MLFLKESLLLVLILCVCWDTGEAVCWIECDESQIGLTEPTCYLKDDATEAYCEFTVNSEDTAIRTLESFDKLNIVFDLQTRVGKLTISNYLNINLKLSTFKFHLEITSLLLNNGNLPFRKTQINPGLFMLLPNLKYISMTSVFFEYFPYFAYTNKFLTYLHVSQFEIPSSAPHSLSRGYISGLTELKHLRLESIQTTQHLDTTDRSFAGLTSLTYLLLGRFNIHNPINTLSPLTRVRDLRLINCGLADMSFLNRTPSLYGLTRLVLNANFITEIQASIFSNYTNLVELYLHSNKLVQLESEAFRGLNNLETLYLDSNPIQDISITAFKGLKFLTRLYLEYNSFTSLSSRMFEYLSNLKYMGLSDVPLHCDCSLQWMPRVHHNFGLYLSLTKCATPPEHIHKQAIDPSLYTDCIQELSYQCFNSSTSCPTGSYCQDTLDTYTCVCEQEEYQFVRSVNTCVSSEEIRNSLQRLGVTTN